MCWLFLLGGIGKYEQGKDGVFQEKAIKGKTEYS